MFWIGIALILGALLGALYWYFFRSSKKFNADEAKDFLLERERKKREQAETERKQVLEQSISVLQEEFRGSSVEVYLIGSVLQPHRFSSRSDVDVVLKNYTGDRFDFWAKLERRLGRKVEIILFETCRFQEFVLKDGFRVV